MWIYGWEEAELRQLRRDAACSFRDNLIWLEEMSEFAERFSQARIKDSGLQKIPPEK